MEKFSGINGNRPHSKEKYAIDCHGDSVPEIGSCGIVNLTYSEYLKQMNRPHKEWYCPNCGSTATWAGQD